MSISPIALRKAKIICNFGLSECNRVNNTVLSWYWALWITRFRNVSKLEFQAPEHAVDFNRL